MTITTDQLVGLMLGGMLIGFTLGILVWQIADTIHGKRWLGQERRRAERRKEGQ